MIDWNLLFTQGFRGPNTQKMVEQIFQGEKEIIMSRENFEQIIVQVCSALMKEVPDEFFDNT